MMLGRNKPSNLHELRFRGCQDLDPDALQALKVVGSWDALDQVTVEECNSLECNGILEAVAEGKL